jgi:glutaminase
MIGCLCLTNEICFASLHTLTCNIKVVSVGGEHVQSTYIRNFEQSIIEAMDKYNAPGIVASLIDNREIAYSKAFGVSKIGDFPVPVTTDTIFSIMSITKSFTASAIMQLVETMNIALAIQFLNTCLTFT